MLRRAAVLPGLLLLAACAGGGRPDAAFDGLREAARRSDLPALRSLLAAPARADLDREWPDLATPAGREAFLAAHGGELALLAGLSPAGWEIRDGGRAVVRVRGEAGPERGFALAREGGAWRFADVREILRFDPERRARLARLGRIGAALRELRRQGRKLPDRPGNAFLAAVLPEADRALAEGLLGPSSGVMEKLAAGETPLILAADGGEGAPARPDGLCVLFEDGRPQFLPFGLLAPGSGAAVPAGPGSPDPRLAQLVFAE